MNLRQQFVGRARAVLNSRQAPRALALLGLLIALPSLTLGYQLDDRTYLRSFEHGRSPIELLHESPSAVEEATRLGVVAWWSNSNFTLHFLRPATAWSHWLEFHYWPHAPWLMHLTNVVLYVALVAVAALVYRELFAGSPKLGGLAALMFTLDDSHAQSVGWIASRHIVVSTLFALLALLLHIRGSRCPGPRRLGFRLASVACSALALASSEYGVAALAYLAAYVSVFETGPARARFKAALPHALVGVAWLVTYVAMGCGVRGASWYRDPITAPAELLLQGLADLPLWLSSQLGGEVSNAALMIPETAARWIAFVLLLLPLVVLLWPPLRRSTLARFFAIGMLLSCLLLFATVPQDRLLLAASFGGFGWVTCFLGTITAQSSAVLRNGGVAFRFSHLWFAPLAFVPSLTGLRAIDDAARALADAVPMTGTAQAIAVNVPLEFLTNSAWSFRQAHRAPLHQLYAGFSKLTATRPNSRTLELAAEDSWGARPSQRMFASRPSMPSMGEVRDVEGMRATVVAVDANGLPNRVRFEFPDALEASGRVWLVWAGKRPARWTPPAVGGSVEVASTSLLSLVF